jgi:hypothetical protein
MIRGLCTRTHFPTDLPKRKDDGVTKVQHVLRWVGGKLLNSLTTGRDLCEKVCPRQADLLPKSRHNTPQYYVRYEYWQMWCYAISKRDPSCIWTLSLNQEGMQRGAAQGTAVRAGILDISPKSKKRNHKTENVNKKNCEKLPVVGF